MRRELNAADISLADHILEKEQAAAVRRRASVMRRISKALGVEDNQHIYLADEDILGWFESEVNFPWQIETVPASRPTALESLLPNPCSTKLWREFADARANYGGSPVALVFYVTKKSEFVIYETRYGLQDASLPALIMEGADRKDGVQSYYVVRHFNHWLKLVKEEPWMTR